MANTKVLRDALAMARKYPEQHDQRSFCRNTAKPNEDDAEPLVTLPVAADNGEHPDCGTTLCLAGWIGFLNAPKGSRIEYNGTALVMPDGERVQLDSYARELAGLNAAQELALFYSLTATAAELEVMIDRIEREPDLDDPYAISVEYRTRTDREYT